MEAKCVFCICVRVREKPCVCEKSVLEKVGGENHTSRYTQPQRHIDSRKQTH